MRGHIAWLVLVLLGACTDEVTIAPNTCGNFVLEAGEDCDQPGGVCTAQCRFACVRDSTDCTTAGNCCPGGMACGLDGSCHAPTGTLSPSEVSAAFDVSEFRALDLDGDGIADVLGTGQGSVLARYGSVDAPLASLVSREAPFANGPDAFGDFSGNGHVGVLLPTTGGLFAFDTSSGAPEAIAFPTTTDATTQHWKIDDAGKVELDLVASSTMSQRAVRITIAPAAPAQPCGASNDIDSRLVRGRGVHTYTDGTRLLVPMSILSGVAQTTVCVHASSGASVSGTINRLAPPDGETLLANLDSATTACPALLVPYVDATGNGRTNIILPTGLAGSCTFPTTAGAFTPLATTLEGYPLATIALATGKTGVITSAGVWTVDTTLGQVKTVTDSTRDWRYAVVGDLNGDGIQDFATGATGADGEAFLQRLDVTGTIVGWDAFRLVTGGGVYSLATGDYDGDGFGDVALATVDPTNDRTGSIAVAYGGSSGTGLTTPVAGPSFPEFNGFTTAALVDRSVPTGFDHSDDLIVAYAGDGLSADDPGTLTNVFGSSERQLQAPFAYDSTFGGSGGALPAQGEAVAIGHFGGATTAVALFGHAKTSVTGYSNATAAPLAWQTGAGTFTAATDNPFNVTFKLADGHVFSTAYDGGEVLVALAAAAINSTTCGLFYFVAPTAGSPSSGTATCAMATGGSANSSLEAVTALRTIADEGTANPKVLVDQVVASKLYVATEWTMSVNGGTPSIATPIHYNDEVAAALGINASMVGCSDATAAELGTRDKDGKTYGAGLDRVAACRVPDPATMMASVTLFGRFAAPDGSAPLYVPLVDTKLDLQVDVEAGDFNGDGLDDIVFTAGPPGFTSVHLYLQCDTHGGGCTAKAGS
jgi:hypothetical protein